MSAGAVTDVQLGRGCAALPGRIFPNVRGYASKQRISWVNKFRTGSGSDLVCLGYAIVGLSRSS